MHSPLVQIRKAERSDCFALYSLIKELAVFEKAPDEVITSPEILEKDGFGTHPAFFAWVAEIDNIVVGMCLCYIRYSTWKGKTLYLEDLYIQPEYRKLGIGSKLFEVAVQHAQTQKFKRMTWQVLDWNTPAIEFYKKHNATLDPEWVNGVLDFN